jgi:hypothetical protein
MFIPLFDVSPREMDSPTLPPSLWAATAEPAPLCPPLRGESRTDVAVVGGGFAGLSTAVAPENTVRSGSCPPISWTFGIIRRPRRSLSDLRQRPTLLEAIFGSASV